MLTHYTGTATKWRTATHQTTDVKDSASRQPTSHIQWITLPPAPRQHLADILALPEVIRVVQLALLRRILNHQIIVVNKFLGLSIDRCNKTFLRRSKLTEVGVRPDKLIGDFTNVPTTGCRTGILRYIHRKMTRVSSSVTKRTVNGFNTGSAHRSPCVPKSNSATRLVSPTHPSSQGNGTTRSHQSNLRIHVHYLRFPTMRSGLVTRSPRSPPVWVPPKDICRRHQKKMSATVLTARHDPPRWLNIYQHLHSIRKYRRKLNVITTRHVDRPP